MEGTAARRGALVAGSTVLAVVVVLAAALGYWLSETERDATPAGSTLVLRRISRPWVAERCALCVPGADCTDVSCRLEWWSVLEDPPLVRGFEEDALREELLVDPATGTLRARLPLPTGAESRMEPRRVGGVIVEVFASPGILVRTVDPRSGVVRSSWTLDALHAQVVARGEDVITIENLEARWELPLPDGPPRNVVPTGADDAHVTSGPIFVARGGVLEMLDEHGEHATVIGRPGAGHIENAAACDDLSVVVWQSSAPPGETPPELVRLGPDETSPGLTFVLARTGTRERLDAVAIPDAAGGRVDALFDEGGRCQLRALAISDRGTDWLTVNDADPLLVREPTDPDLGL